MNLRNIGRIFLIKSKGITISCISSVLITVVLIISMLNLTRNAEASYEDKIRAAYGDIDIIATYMDYSGIPDTTTDQIKKMKGIDQVSAGYFDADFMIENNSVYLVAGDNSNLMKARYYYDTNIQTDEIVINSVFAETLQCKVNDTIAINGSNFRVIEVIEDFSGSAVNIAMAILNQTGLTGILGLDTDINFILISVKDNYDMDLILNQISSIDGKLYLNVVEADELYKDAVESFSIFIKAVAICVIIVAGLIMAGTMRRFVYKYKHDMAIIRAIGGSTKQVKYIFRYLIIIINTIGSISGFAVSVIFHTMILRLINEKIQLIEGNIRFYFWESLSITALIFIFLTFILVISTHRSFQILPLEAFQDNELCQIGKGNKRPEKSNLYHFMRLPGRDTYVMIKSMLSRIKENFLIIGTIVIIVVISFIGGGLSNILHKNNNEYLKREYLADIVITSSYPIQYEDIEPYYKQLKGASGTSASITLYSQDDASFQNEALSFLIADMDSMQTQGILSSMATGTNRIILNDKVAEKFNISEGDYIKVLTPSQYKYDSNGLPVELLVAPYEVRMHVIEILPKDMLQNFDALIDMNCNDFMKTNYMINRIYVNGDLDKAEQLLRQIKTIYSGIKWSNIEEVIKVSNKVLRERFVIFEVVVSILILIAGQGWVNAIRHAILSRKDEYRILRIHGMTLARLRNMLFIQIIIYLVTGIVSGTGIGAIVLMLLTYLEGGTILAAINFNSLMLISIFLIILNIMLIPDILKVSKTEIAMSE